MATEQATPTVSGTSGREVGDVATFLPSTTLLSCAAVFLPSATLLSRAVFLHLRRHLSEPRPAAAVFLSCAAILLSCAAVLLSCAAILLSCAVF